MCLQGQELQRLEASEGRSVPPEGAVAASKSVGGAYPSARIPPRIHPLLRSFRSRFLRCSVPSFHLIRLSLFPPFLQFRRLRTFSCAFEKGGLLSTA